MGLGVDLGVSACPRSERLFAADSQLFVKGRDSTLMKPKHHIEQEIKLTAPDEATLLRVLDSQLINNTLHHSSNAQPAKRFAAIYYDTPDWHLRKLRWSLRTRDEQVRHVCTLKRNSELVDGISSCEEMEQLVVAGFNRVADIPAGAISDAFKPLLSGPTPLLPRVNVQMQRNQRILQIGDTMLELVTDAGHITANGRQYDLFEVELERLSGDLLGNEIQAFVAQLIQQFKLHKSQASKHKIGLSLY